MNKPTLDVHPLNKQLNFNKTQEAASLEGARQCIETNKKIRFLATK